MSKIKDIIIDLEFLLDFDYIILKDKSKDFNFINSKKVREIIIKYKE